MYPIPKEINSDIKITRFVSLTDLLFLCAFGMIALAFNGQVHSQFRGIYGIYCGCLGLFLGLLPVRSSANKRCWEGYLFWLFSNTRYYVKFIKEDRHEEPIKS